MNHVQKLHFDLLENLVLDLLKTIAVFVDVIKDVLYSFVGKVMMKFLNQAVLNVQQPHVQ